MLIRTLILTLGLALATPALAEEDQLLGRYGGWEAHKLDRDGQTTCYAIAKPKTKLPKKLNRDETYFMVSHWPARDKIAEPSIVAGYLYQEGSVADVTVGKTKFRFFTKGDGAWLQENEDEVRLVAAMKKGGSMVVKGTSARGTKTTDTYHLSGLPTALDKAAKACK